MAKDTFPALSLAEPTGKRASRDYHQSEPLIRLHTQIGVDDCSTDLGLRGQPVFRGLIGPMPEGKNASSAMESPEVFESLTKEWTADKAQSGVSRTKAPA